MRGLDGIMNIRKDGEREGYFFMFNEGFRWYHEHKEGWREKDIYSCLMRSLDGIMNIRKDGERRIFLYV